MFPSKIPGSSVVKSTVKSAFKGKGVNVTIAALLPLLAGAIFYMLISVFKMVLPQKTEILIVAILFLSAVFIVYPVLLGAVRYFWRLTDGAEEPVTEVFYYYYSFFLYKRAVKTALLLVFKCFTALFTCLVPYLIVTVLSNGWIYRFLGAEVPLWVAGLALVQSFLRLVGIFSGIAVIFRYYLFPAIAVMDDSMLLLEAMHISVMVSRRSVGEFLTLLASFFGWMLLSLLALPLVYTAPLFLGCYVVHCRYALVNYNLSLDFYAKDKYF